MRERLRAMLARVKADSELQDSSELVHVTGELTKSLGAEIKALERAIAEVGKSQASEVQKRSPKDHNERDAAGGPRGPSSQVEGALRPLTC
jgi:hypothetical protein